jgi:hypothetical protein
MFAPHKIAADTLHTDGLAVDQRPAQHRDGVAHLPQHLEGEQRETKEGRLWYRAAAAILYSIDSCVWNQRVRDAVRKVDARAGCTGQCRSQYGQTRAGRGRERFRDFESSARRNKGDR